MTDKRHIMRLALLVLAGILQIVYSANVKSEHTVEKSLQPLKKKIISDPFLAQVNDPTAPQESTLAELDSFIFKDHNHFGMQTFDGDNTALVVIIIILLILICVGIVCCCCFCCAVGAAQQEIIKEQHRKQKDQEKDKDKPDEEAKMMEGM